MEQTVYNLQSVAAAYPFGEWVTVSLLANQGANSFVRRVETVHDGEFVLRILTNGAPPSRFRFELELMKRLSRMALSFGVPAPVPTVRGTDFVYLEMDGVTRPAILSRLIPGTLPVRDNLQHCRLAGAGLGELTLALEQLPLDLNDPTVAPYPPYDDVYHIHPAISDPLTALDDFEIVTETRQAFYSLTKEVLAALPSIYGGLPRQLIHTDYIRANVLLDAERLSGIVDFEFASADLRAMDIAILISHWPYRYLGKGTEWPVIEALLAGYKEYVQLSDVEAAAIPTLINLRNIVTTLHFVGRSREGLTTQADAAGWIVDTLGQAEWVAKNSRRITQLTG
jgi:homoserine kinase type II